MYQGAPAADLVVSVLLDVAELEFRVKSLYEKLLDSKMTRWDEAKTDASNCIIELAEFFSGAKVLARKIKDDNLQKWFDSIAGEVRKLAYTEPVSAGRKIQQLINALEEVEQFHQFDGILQTKQYLADTRSHLTRMVRIANVQESFLASFEVVSDISYAWGHIINAYTAQMHDRIRRDPFSTLKLRCLFLKLKSIMELPLLRISQCNSGDLLSVSEYYSNMLINYVRMVLEVIPRTMFETLNVIIQVQTEKLKELPTRLEKDRLREFAQLDERFQLAQATHSISAFTHGILAMEQTLLGVIKIEPKKLLEDGIRKQLVLRISDICHKELVFVQKEVGMFSTRIVELDFQQCLHNVATQLAGFRRSFEYIQDYVNIYGLRVWQEEFQRIINYNVEQECNTFLKKQVPDWQSSYQSTSIPIPRHKPLDGDSSVNFMGRLTRELLRQTNPEKTLYLYPLSGWFDYEGKEVVGIRMFALLKESVGVLGLSGIDKLLCFMVVHRLQQLVTLLRSPKLESTWKDTVRRFHAQVEPLGGLPEAGIALYEETLSKMPKIWGAFLTTTAFLGQAQLLRRQCSVELSSTCKLDSNSLSCALEATNTALLTDIQAHYKNPESKPYPEASPILPEVAKYLTTAGIHNPISQIYITTDPLDDLPVLAFLFTLTQLPKYYVDSHLSVLAPKGRKSGPSGTLDCCPLVIGVLTLLRQFHSSHTQTFIQYMAQYIRVLLQPAKGGGSNDQRSPNSAFSVETACAIQFLEDLTRYGQIAREVVQMYVPPFVIDHRD
ncbi:hypothetical protein CYMTET_37489 [Cymbomonas tetramitiformis]|uniref:WASH complex subunit strumpellin n=1 Tax=Cymbomonas tetramitiformis TaxID=36881 RepID=A0AAE0F7H9_9CHLO|nr:hypothetical protein CYMTET_37489 [Cymbomonas tetramitiformis]